MIRYKPENLLLASMENDSDVKLADFGFAKKANGIFHRVYILFSDLQLSIMSIHT